MLQYYLKGMPKLWRDMLELRAYVLRQAANKVNGTVEGDEACNVPMVQKFHNIATGLLTSNNFFAAANHQQQHKREREQELAANDSSKHHTKWTTKNISLVTKAVPETLGRPSAETTVIKETPLSLLSQEVERLTSDIKGLLLAVTQMKEQYSNTPP